MGKQPGVPPTLPVQQVQIAPLELVFNSSQIVVQRVQTPEGEVRQLVVVHPSGFAAVIPMPLDTAKNIGAQLMAPGIHMPQINGQPE